MKTLRMFLLLTLFVAVTSFAYAFQCEEVQGLNGTEECWTKVTLSSFETNLVSAGHVLVYEGDATTPKQGAYQVKRSSASTDDSMVAGVAQRGIKSGDSALILVRGYGVVYTVGGIASGDKMKVTSGGAVGMINVGAATSVQTVAVALETSSTNATTVRRAFIKLW